MHLLKLAKKGNIPGLDWRMGKGGLQFQGLKA